MLVVNLGGIGDLLLSFPALEALKGRYPGCRFELLAVERVRPLAESRKLFETVHVFERSPLRLIPLLLGLRKKRYDVCVNMRTMASWKGALKIFLMLGLIHARVSAGRNTDGRGWFFDIKVPEKDPGEKYEAEYDLDTAGALGAEAASGAIRLSVDEESSARVRGILESAGIRPGERLVVVHPGGMASRRWPAESFCAAMEMIASRAPCRFAVTGNAAEAPLCGTIAAGTGAVSLAGRLDLDETIALIRGCALIISNDTGPMHLAAALGVPLVAIFGPGQLKRFDPRTISKNSAVMHKSVPCAPCVKPSCPDLRCLKAIKAEEVAAAALGLMERKQVP
jgi:heptosyltransferase-2